MEKEIRTKNKTKETTENKGFQCEACGYAFGEKKELRCPRCGTVQKQLFSCSGNCGKCHQGCGVK